MKRFLLPVLVAGLTGFGPVGQVDAEQIPHPYFAEETGTAGVSHTYTGGADYYVGGGVAALDCNTDGRPDLFMAGGTSPARLYENISAVGKTLKFEERNVLEEPLLAVTGAYPLDIDNDGHQDLFVLRIGENKVLRGLGDCRFEVANEQLGIDGSKLWSTAFSAIWEKGSSWPTLAVGNYIDRRAPGSPYGTCQDNQLYRFNTELGRYDTPLALTPGYCALSMLFSDWKRSGTPDLRVSNDREYYRGGEEQLWQMNAAKAPRLYDRSQGWRRIRIWGMGIASHDVSGNGFPEYFLTSMADNKLRGLTGDKTGPVYFDYARARGVTAHRPFPGDRLLPSTAWHADFQDVNNDGYVDLFIAKGNIDSMPDFAMKDPNNLLMGKPDGRFVEAAHLSGVASEARGRGGAVADFNLDGLPDLVVVNRKAPAQVWRNLGRGTPARPLPMGNWINLKLQQPGANRSGIGSWIEVRVGNRTLRREVVIGGGHAGDTFVWSHFGIGVAERAKVRVLWPDGQWGPWIRLFANQFAHLVKGRSEATIWLPPR